MHAVAVETASQPTMACHMLVGKEAQGDVGRLIFDLVFLAFSTTIQGTKNALQSSTTVSAWNSTEST